MPNYLGTPISGATGATYELTADDVGQYIFCDVTAHNTAGSTTQSSNLTGLIAGPFDPAGFPGARFYRADTGVTHSGADTTAWADQGANTQHLNVVSTSKPQYSATGFLGSHPGISFITANSTSLGRDTFNFHSNIGSVFFLMSQTGSGAAFGAMVDLWSVSSGSDIFAAGVLSR
jgi:hypothetical protein